MCENKIYGINGPVVTIKGKTNLGMLEMVFVGNDKLAGEVIGINDDITTIQVYEETGGLRPGEPVISTGSPMSVTLGPGLLTNIFDGIERPLRDLEAITGPFITRGADVPPLSNDKKWSVTIKVSEGDRVSGGDIFAECPETAVITHRAMVPPAISGTVTKVLPDGEYTVNETIAEITDDKGNIHALTLCQKWPIRNPRPTGKRIPSDKPLVTGQRIIDTVFPVAKGGAAAIPAASVRVKQ